jgi:succinate dehydrogenase/fumarate reductase flavoprotein subunit
MNADVIVVGGGGSGLAAAIEARACGADVVLLEKNAELGGTTARSIGSITATRTRYQARDGIEDSPDEHLRDWALLGRHVGRPDNEALCRLLTERVPETIRWLDAAGVEFLGPLEEPPHTKRRMHQVMPNSRAYIYHLERLARRAGVRIVTKARARRLLVEDGAVRGVEYETASGAVITAHAARGVVLAAGDYAGAEDLKRDFISDAVARTEAVNPTATGDGHRMALELGARIVNRDLFGGGARFVRPAKPSWQSRLPPSRWLMRPAGWMLRRLPAPLVRRFIMSFMTTIMVPARELYEAGAVLMNRNGERFADEAKPIIEELAYQPDGLAYILFDGAIAGQFTKWPHYISTAPGIAYAYLQDYERTRPDLVRKAPTLEALAPMIGADGARLVAAIDAYNRGEAAEGAPARGSRPALSRSPYYALGPVRNYVNYTDGGLAVDMDLRVLGPGDRPIPGLFAAGSNGQSGLLLKGHGHHLGWAFTSGRIAGRNAASGSSEPARLETSPVAQEA